MGTAIKSQKAKLYVATTEAAAKTITGITAASPPVVTSNAHGYSDGDIIRITGVVGMTEVNERAFVVASSLTNTFELKGVDGTAYTAYASGGSAYKQTMAQIANVASITGFDGVADEIDVTHLDSTAKEFLIGLQDFGNLTLELQVISGDSGQSRLRTLKGGGTIGTFKWQLSNLEVSAFRALVKSFPAGTPSNDAVRSSVQLRVTSEPSWFA